MTPPPDRLPAPPYRPSEFAREHAYYVALWGGCVCERQARATRQDAAKAARRAFILEMEITRLRASIRTLEFLLGVCVLAIPALIFALTLMTLMHP